MASLEHRTKRMAVLACIQALLLHSALAYNKNNRLVDYRDRVTITDSNDSTDETIYSIDLMSFPYMTDVSNKYTQSDKIAPYVCMY